jgi:hypothetical protein
MFPRDGDSSGSGSGGAESKKGVCVFCDVHVF